MQFSLFGFCSDDVICSKLHAHLKLWRIHFLNTMVSFSTLASTVSSWSSVMDAAPYGLPVKLGSAALFLWQANTTIDKTGRLVENISITFRHPLMAGGCGAVAGMMLVLGKDESQKYLGALLLGGCASMNLLVSSSVPKLGCIFLGTSAAFCFIRARQLERSDEDRERNTAKFYRRAFAGCLFGIGAIAVFKGITDIVHIFKDDSATSLAESRLIAHERASTFGGTTSYVFIEAEDPTVRPTKLAAHHVWKWAGGAVDVTDRNTIKVNQCVVLKSNAHSWGLGKGVDVKVGDGAWQTLKHGATYSLKRDGSLAFKSE